MNPARRAGAPFAAPHRRGYTLIEAMVALSLTAMAGSVVLLTVETSLDAASQSLEQTVAAGIAEQTLDEVLGARYCEPGVSPYQSPLGPNAWELQGAGRSRFNDTDDYHGFAAQPPRAPWGVALGQEDEPGKTRHPNFHAPDNGWNQWRQRIEVYYVNEANPAVRLSGNQTSNYRAVEVVVERRLPSGAYLELARLRRVCVHLPVGP